MDGLYPLEGSAVPAEPDMAMNVLEEQVVVTLETQEFTHHNGGCNGVGSEARDAAHHGVISHLQPHFLNMRTPEEFVSAFSTEIRKMERENFQAKQHSLTLETTIEKMEDRFKIKLDFVQELLEKEKERCSQKESEYRSLMQEKCELEAHHKLCDARLEEAVQRSGELRAQLDVLDTRLKTHDEQQQSQLQQTLTLLQEKMAGREEQVVEPNARFGLEEDMGRDSGLAQARLETAEVRSKLLDAEHRLAAAVGEAEQLKATLEELKNASSYSRLNKLEVMVKDAKLDRDNSVLKAAELNTKLSKSEKVIQKLTNDSAELKAANDLLEDALNQANCKNALLESLLLDLEAKQKRKRGLRPKASTAESSTQSESQSTVLTNQLEQEPQEVNDLAADTMESCTEPQNVAPLPDNESQQTEQQVQQPNMAVAMDSTETPEIIAEPQNSTNIEVQSPAKKGKRVQRAKVAMNVLCTPENNTELQTSIQTKVQSPTKQKKRQVQRSKTKDLTNTFETINEVSKQTEAPEQPKKRGRRSKMSKNPNNTLDDTDVQNALEALVQQKKRRASRPKAAKDSEPLDGSDHVTELEAHSSVQHDMQEVEESEHTAEIVAEQQTSRNSKAPSQQKKRRQPRAAKCPVNTSHDGPDLENAVIELAQQGQTMGARDPSITDAIGLEINRMLEEEGETSGWTAVEQSKQGEQLFEALEASAEPGSQVEEVTAELLVERRTTRLQSRELLTQTKGGAHVTEASILIESEVESCVTTKSSQLPALKDLQTKEDSEAQKVQSGLRRLEVQLDPSEVQRQIANMPIPPPQLDAEAMPPPPKRSRRRVSLAGHESSVALSGLAEEVEEQEMPALQPEAAILPPDMDQAAQVSKQPSPQLQAKEQKNRRRSWGSPGSRRRPPRLCPAQTDGTSIAFLRTRLAAQLSGAAPVSPPSLEPSVSLPDSDLMCDSEPCLEPETAVNCSTESPEDSVPPPNMSPSKDSASTTDCSPEILGDPEDQEMVCAELPSTLAPGVTTDDIEQQSDQDFSLAIPSTSSVSLESLPDSASEPAPEIFKCEACHSLLPSKQDLGTHNMVCSLTRCPTCHLEFENAKLRRNHVLLVHYDFMPCGMCSKNLKLSSLDRHVRSVHQTDAPRQRSRPKTTMPTLSRPSPKPKKRLSKTDPTPPTESETLTPKTSVERFPCQLCNTSYADAYGYKRHLTTVMHRNNEQKEMVMENTTDEIFY